MKVELYNYAVKAGLTRRGLLKGAASLGGLAALGGLGAGLGARPAAAQDAELRKAILAIPGRRHGLAHRCGLAEGRRDVPWRDQGQCRRGRVRGCRADLHGPEQPEPAQRPVPRLPEVVGSLYRRQDQLDRPGAGRLQRRVCSSRSPPAPSTSTSSRWARRSRATPPARACWTRCPTGSRTQIDMDDYVGYLQGRRSAPGTARPIASRSTATATPSPTARTISATRRSVLRPA